MVKIAAHAVGFSVLTLPTQTGVLAYLAALGAGRAMSGRSRKGPARLAATMLALAAAYTGPWAVSAALASRFGRTPLRCLVSAKSQLARRWGVRSDIIRFQGCRAARHDDHVHIQIGP